MTVRRLRLVVVAALVVAAAVVPGIVTARHRASVRPVAASHTVGRRPRPRRVGAAGRLDLGRQPPAPAALHLVLVIEENHGFGQIIGSRSAPFVNQLAARGTLLTRYQAITHPSLPNYVALIAGSTLGVNSDCHACQLPATNLVDQLQAAGISWKAYYQGLPAPGSPVVRAGAYTKSVDPFLHFRDVSAAPARARRVVPLSQLRADLAQGWLPRLVVIVPDLRHDMHSGTVAAGDAFLRHLYRELRAAPGIRGSLRLVVTFDEGRRDQGPGGGRVATIVAGSGVPAGVRDATPYNHYALLRSVEQLFGLPALRHAGDPATNTIAAVTLPRPAPDTT